ncbi:MAG: cation:proton antiporter [Candidatus Sumerlaeia bacterium]|nr:cation:proton antiporter [Candidatus Sumerlaeia bacterium]
MTHDQITIMFFALALLLGVARLLGELARHFQQPAVLGEILAGILLGPTILGTISPGLLETLFPQQGTNAQVLHGITTLCVVLFLMVAGMEVDLSTIFRLHRPALLIGMCGVVGPFFVGFALGHWFPRSMGMEAGANHLAFSMFLGVALAISALPVIAKTLIDLRLFRTDLGMVVIAVAIFHDIVGWVLFAIVIALMNADSSRLVYGITTTIGLTFLYIGVMLTVGRWLIDRLLPWIQANTSWPAGILGFSTALALLGAATTEAIGIHAIFGAFIVGVAIGDSRHLQQRTRNTIEHFISAVFAPIFFASIGLKVNFVHHFDLPLVLLVIAIACAVQALGSALGAMWAGFPRRQSWAIGFALNARGAMEIVLATLALQHGIIGERLFVALVVMALFTSIIAGPLMQKVIRRKTAVRFRKFLSAQGFVAQLKAATAPEAIGELAAVASRITGVPADDLAAAVLERERIMSTALPGGLAVPHARIEGLARPVVVVGMSENGIPFDAPDGEAARLVLMVLASPLHSQQHLELLADIATTFQDPVTTARASAAVSMTHFLAVVNTAEESTGHAPAPRVKAGHAASPPQPRA